MTDGLSVEGQKEMARLQAIGRSLARPSVRKYHAAKISPPPRVAARVLEPETCMDSGVINRSPVDAARYPGAYCTGRPEHGTFPEAHIAELDRVRRIIEERERGQEGERS